MKNITIRDIVKMTGGTLICMNEQEDEGEVAERSVSDLCVDTRVIGEGDLFVALPGENTDGHRFVPKALETAAAAVVDRKPEEIYTSQESLETAKKRGDVLILVEDTSAAHLAIGAGIRMQYERAVISVTGSVGKTTTRRMISTALGSSREVYETPKNFNSWIGVPIATSRMLDEPSEVAVLELGIDRIGEMDRLRSVVRPEIAVVTMIGTCHMEYFGSKEMIREQKLRCATQDTVLFLNADDPMLWEMKGKTGTRETWYYGFRDEADYRAENAELTGDGAHFTYCHRETRVPVELPVAGRHNVLNATVAMAICDYLGLDLTGAAKALADFVPMRQINRQMTSGTRVIDDVYNASPDSMKALLDVLSESEVTGKRWAVLGDMFELGSNELERHAEVGDFFAGKKVDCLVTVGTMAKTLGEHAAKALPGLQYRSFDTNAEAVSFLKENLAPEDMVVVKASHGMHFDEIVEGLVPGSHPTEA